MDMKQCPRGHFYDGELNTSCPECAAENRNGNYGGMDQSMFDGIGITEPVDYGFESGSDDPADGFGIGGSETKAPDQTFSGSETMQFYEESAPGVDNYSDQTMAYNPGKVVGFTPVVGWLVCVEGPDRGNDYRIRTGYNHIGRAEHMDVCIRGDKQVSREKHALIAYDDEEKVFFFGHSEGRNIVRINDRMVMVPSRLAPYDTVTVGSSKLIFVPLCGEHFDWDK